MIQDYSKVNEHPDHVICNNCGEEMLVDCDTEQCPHCGLDGCLMDIEQEINDEK